MGQADIQEFTFRPEIEGLRAIAVLAVIASHAEIAALEGGYLGVDIFFVISGYLIARRMVSEMATESFSLLAFYERRARRILPALFLVLACTTPFALVLLVAPALENFGQSLFASVLFSNNILLTLTSNYWSQEAAFKPLLHTWSLGVEEQFYLLLPLLLWPIVPLKRWATLILILLLAASVAGGIYIVSANPPASFYLLPTRGWELLAGIVIAVAGVRIVDRQGLVRLAGLSLIMAGVLSGDALSLHPSLSAASVVAGTALLIACDGYGSATVKMLGARPMMMMGAASYALYLWHQPIYAFLRVLSESPPPTWQYVALFPIIGALAALTVQLEKRYRSPSLVPTRRFVIHMVGFGGTLAAIGLVLHLANGLPGRHAATRGVDGLDPAIYNARIRDFSSHDQWTDGRTRVLLVGNSRARDFGNVLIEADALEANALFYDEFLPVCTPEGTRSAELLEAEIVIIESVAWTPNCSQMLIDAGKDPDRIFVLGPREFAFSVEPYLWLDREDRAALRVPYLPNYARWNQEAAAHAAPAHYVDYYQLLSGEGESLPLFDGDGRLVTSDRVHLTRAGAQLVARQLAMDPAFAWMK